MIKAIKVAFLDRDGTLVFEPQDTLQVGPGGATLLPGVVDCLKRLRDGGYEFVMVTNQDGLGTKKYPKRGFDAVQKELFAQLDKEGIEIADVLVCPHFEKDGCDCRKPKIGLVKKFLQNRKMDKTKSFVVGDRETDAQFAKNIGVSFFKTKTNGPFPRIAAIERITKETSIFAVCNLDGSGEFSVDTGIKFFDHMLEQLSKHSLIDLMIRAKGDLKIDEHHTIEDTALALGEAISKALGERAGIKRYGFLLPMDDTLAEVAIDLGGRPYLVFKCEFKRETVGDLPTEMVEHFFRSLSESLKANIHVDVRYSKNEHHKIEAIFKAFARALRGAVERDPRSRGGLPTTKGALV